MGHASAAADQRESGQHALFGDGGAGLAPIRLAAVSPWSLSERMTQAKDAFGFYLAAHTADRYWQWLDATRVRSVAALDEAGAPVGGGSTRRSLADVAKGAGGGTSARGKRMQVGNG